MKRNSLFVLFFTFFIHVNAKAQNNYRKFVHANDSLNYYLIPPNKKIIEGNPLIVYLHGGSFRGDSTGKVLLAGPTPYLEKNENNTFFILVPICPIGENWIEKSEIIIQLLKLVTQNNNNKIDTNKIYLTGHSLGGNGTIYIGEQYPTLFAAILPLSAGYYWNQKTPVIKNTPVWAIHGAKDQLISTDHSKRLFKQIRRLNKKFKYTLLKQQDHYILDYYKKKEIYEWFLSNKRNT